MPVDCQLASMRALGPNSTQKAHEDLNAQKNSKNCGFYQKCVTKKLLYFTSNVIIIIQCCHSNIFLWDGLS